jgi:hypothetical protein
VGPARDKSSIRTNVCGILRTMARGKPLNATAERVYRASDLNRRGREVLDAARETGVRIADKDGLSMLMLPESLVVEAARSSDERDSLVDAYATLFDLDAGESVAVEAMRWVNRLTPEDRGEFQEELRGEIRRAGRHDDVSSLLAMLSEWQVTSTVSNEPGYLDVLDDPFKAEDFIEVGRPE